MSSEGPRSTGRVADVLRGLLNEWCDTRADFNGHFTNHYPIDDSIHGHPCDASEAWGCNTCGEAWPCLVSRSFDAINNYDRLRDAPDCDHEECHREFWEDGGGDNIDEALVAHIIAISKGQHPANGVRDDDEQLGNFFGFGRDDGHRAMGLPKEQRKRWKLHDRRDGTIRRGLSILGGDLAGPRLSWGSERGPTLDAGQGGAGSVRMGPEVHGGPVARLGDGPDVWIVKP